MKPFLLIIYTLCSMIAVRAQSWNPFVNSTNISESPIDLEKGEYVDLSFIIGNGGSLPLNNLSNPLRAVVSLTGFQPADMANPVSTVSGASYFNVSYYPQLNTYFLEQSVPIPAALNGGVNAITIRVRVTTMSSEETPKNGFQVNLTPPAYTSSFNNVNDDRAEVITYTLNSFLPVELVSFSGEVADCQAFLKWVTASELNNDYFLVEKSTDAVSWTEIGKVAGNGNSVVPQNYEWVDTDIQSQDTYYRLVQVDYDGTKDYSHIIAVSAPDCGKSMYRIYPNPAQDVLYVDAQNPVAGEYVSSFFSSSGQLVKTVMLTDMSSRIYVGDLVPGAYLLQMQTSDKVQSHSIVIQR